MNENLADQRRVALLLRERERERERGTLGTQLMMSVLQKKKKKEGKTSQRYF